MSALNKLLAAMLRWLRHSAGHTLERRGPCPTVATVALFRWTACHPVNWTIAQRGHCLRGRPRHRGRAHE